MLKKVLNLGLLISFVVTMMAPLTGVYIHKMASLLFLVFSIFHVSVYRRRMNRRGGYLMIMLIAAFVTGILGMILEEFSVILAFHKGISIVVMFFLAIHIFRFHKKLW